jgi:lipid A 4'-phosphatase
VNTFRKSRVNKLTPFFATNRKIIFLLFTLGLGPGFLINTVLKQYSGRARPSQIKEFGGNRHFTKAFVVSDQCKRNCSFVSGDASLGYFAFAFIFLARRRRFAIGSAAFVCGTTLGLIRMAQGAHFLSDVIFSGVFTFMVAWLLYLLLIYRQENRQVLATAAYDQRSTSMVI